MRDPTTVKEAAKAPPANLLRRLDEKRKGVFYGWWIVVVSSASHFVMGGLYSTGLTVYFLPISRDLGLSRAALSLAFTLRSLESGLDGPLMGFLVDRLGPRFMVRIGGIVAGLGFVLLAFTHSYLTFLLVFLGVLALGFSAGINQPYMAVVNQWFSRQRALAMTLGYVGTEFGGALLTPLIALVVLNVGWRQAAVLSGILIPIVLLPLSVFIRNTPESMGLRRDYDPPEATPVASRPEAATSATPVEEREDFTVKEALRTPAFWHLAVALGCRMFSKMALHVHLVPLMVWKGLDEQTAALLVGLFALTQIPVRVFGGWVADRWSMTKVPALASLAGIAAVVALLVGKEGSVWTGVLFVLLFALAEAGNIVGWALTGDFFGRRNFATLRGSISMATSPISLPAPTFLGWVFDRTGSYSRALIPVAGFYLLAFFLYMFLRRPRRPVVEPVTGRLDQVPGDP